MVKEWQKPTRKTQGPVTRAYTVRLHKSMQKRPAA